MTRSQGSTMIRITRRARLSHSCRSGSTINWKIQLERNSAGISNTIRRPTVSRKLRMNGMESASGDSAASRNDFSSLESVHQSLRRQDQRKPADGSQNQAMCFAAEQRLAYKTKPAFWKGVRSRVRSSSTPIRRVRGLSATRGRICDLCNAHEVSPVACHVGAKGKRRYDRKPGERQPGRFREHGTGASRNDWHRPKKPA